MDDDDVQSLAFLIFSFIVGLFLMPIFLGGLHFYKLVLLFIESYIIFIVLIIIISIIVFYVFYKKIRKDIDNKNSKIQRERYIQSEKEEVKDLLNKSVNSKDIYAEIYDLEDYSQECREKLNQIKKYSELSSECNKLKKRISDSNKRGINLLEKWKNSQKESVDKNNKYNENKVHIQKQSKPMRILNEDQGYFKIDKDINGHEIEFLKRRGYIVYEGTSINSNKREKFLIKTRYNESPQHCFNCYDIYYYLKETIDKVWLYQTVNPDIVFEINGKKYAIEVETGKVLHDKNRMKLKKTKLNKVYGKNWFFVVTDRNLASEYKKYGRVTDKRYLVGKIIRIINNS
jgi:hypothetical protein